MKRYPHRPGYSPTDTSNIAADLIDPLVETMANKLLEMLKAEPRSYWELEQVTGWRAQTIGARLVELKLKGLIEDSGVRRPTGSGRPAIVWRARDVRELFAAVQIKVARKKGEDFFYLHANGVMRDNMPQREYRFHPTRRWRFDFAWPSIKLAMEIDGGTWAGKSGHNSGAGIARDIEKINEAVILGWRVLRATTNMAKSGEALMLVRRAMAP